MGSFDTFTWQALTVVLTLAGLAGTVVFWRRRGAASGLRMLAVTLLPAAAYLTGTLRLLWQVGDAVVSWAVRLAFNPAVWLGVALAGLSVVLFVLAGLVRRRDAAAVEGGGRAQLPPATSRKASRPPARPTGTAGGKAADDDMAEIEDILKRHGIS